MVFEKFRSILVAGGGGAGGTCGWPNCALSSASKQKDATDAVSRLAHNCSSLRDAVRAGDLAANSKYVALCLTATRIVDQTVRTYPPPNFQLSLVL